MNKNFMKFAFASALAFAGTLSVNAQITAPEWAVDQNATIQHVGENMQLGDRFFLADEVLLVEITSTTATSDYTYEVKVVGINDLKVAGLTELTIPFSDFDKNITTKISAVEAIAAYDPSADKTPLSTDLTGIKKLTVGYAEATTGNVAPAGFGISSVADGAFANLTGITEIISYCEVPPTMTNAVFGDPTNTAVKKMFSTNVKLSVAPSALGTIAGKFATAPGWENFQRIYTVGDIYAFGDFNADGSIGTLDTSDFAVYSKKRGKNYTEPYNEHSVDFDGSGKWSNEDLSLFRTWQKKRFRKI